MFAIFLLERASAGGLTPATLGYEGTRRNRLENAYNPLHEDACWRNVRDV